MAPPKLASLVLAPALMKQVKTVPQQITFQISIGTSFSSQALTRSALGLGWLLEARGTPSSSFTTKGTMGAQLAHVVCGHKLPKGREKHRLESEAPGLGLWLQCSLYLSCSRSVVGLERGWVEALLLLWVTLPWNHCSAAWQQRSERSPLPSLLPHRGSVVFSLEAVEPHPLRSFFASLAFFII